MGARKMDTKALTPAQRHGLEAMLRRVTDFIDFEVLDDGFVTQLRVRWSGPPVITLAVQDERAAKLIRDEDPPSMSMDEWVCAALPGLWGYLPERQRVERICGWCGKMKSETLPADTPPPSPR